MATSTIPDVTAALKTALEARPGLSSVPVVDGFPAAGTFDAPEWIALLDVEFEQNFASINASTKPKDEKYTIDVLISVRQASRADQTTGVDRAIEIFAEIEGLLRDTPNLTGYYTGTGLIFTCEVQGGKLSKRFDNQVREAAIEAQLFVHARI